MYWRVRICIWPSKKKTIESVDLLIIKLQGKITYDGKEYGPYLENLNYPGFPKADYFKPYEYTKITIDYNDISPDVYVEPGEKDMIIFRH